MATTTEKLTGREAIEAFESARAARGAVRVWSYHHVGCAGGQTDWGGEEWVDRLLEPRVHQEAENGSPFDGFAEGNWTAAEWDGESLDLTAYDDYRYSLTLVDGPDGGRPRVAYLGAHAGFEWEGEDYRSDTLKTLLREWLGLSAEDADLAEFGLATCEDFLYGDDGGFWLVADEAKFAATLAGCKALDDRWSDLTGEEVAEYLRTGTEPADGD
jgi:hypothetical protein